MRPGHRIGAWEFNTAGHGRRLVHERGIHVVPIDCLRRMGEEPDAELVELQLGHAARKGCSLRDIADLRTALASLGLLRGERKENAA